MTPSHPLSPAEKLEWFAQSLSSDQLTYPEYYLYVQAIEAEKLDDVAETRQEFKRALASRKISEGISYPEPSRKEFLDFLNSPEAETRIRRARELLILTLNHQKAGRTIAEAERLAMMELFHREAPLSVAEMDEKYFSSPELIRFDLEAFAKVCGCGVVNLRTSQRRQRIFCSNGQLLQLQTYLLRATVVLKLVKNRNKAAGDQAKMLDDLKRRIGLRVPLRLTRNKYSSMDERYFNDLKNIQNDLSAFAAICRCEVKELSTSHLYIESTCSNKEVVKLNTYLSRASKGFGLAKNCKEAKGKMAKTLDELKRKIGLTPKERKGYPLMDEEYFDNIENIRHDLNSFASVYGCEVKKLRTNHKGQEVLCANGEIVKYSTFLSRAAIGLGLAKGSQEGKRKMAMTIDELKQKIGLEVVQRKKYSKMDEGYFKVVKNIQNDLSAFASALGCKVEDLITHGDKAAFCANGELIQLDTYLLRASVGLRLTENQIGAKSKRAETLKLLKKMASNHDLS